MIIKCPAFYRFLVLALFLTGSLQSFCHDHQKDSLPSFLTPATQINKTRLWAVSTIQVAGLTTAMIVLDQMWYEEYPRGGFNFHNDLPDWKQMDKLGHATTAYHMSRGSSMAFRWAGLDNKRSAWLGSLAGISFLGVVEVLDGYSSGWGFSVADFAANKIGAATFLSQQLTWQEQRILWKYSFSPSGLADYRPEILGSTNYELLIKDYNGMTYWLSANLHSLSGGQSIFPPWLNLAVGHSANGMLGSRANPTSNNGNPLPHFERHRQWLLAPDIDWERIPTNSPFLKTVFTTINFIKVPAPAIEYNRIDGWKFHLIFF